jgi:hypothetical protein
LRQVRRPCRRQSHIPEGIAAEQNAAQASDPSTKAAFEEVAANWFALAEQVKWLEKHSIPPQEESHEC